MAKGRTARGRKKQKLIQRLKKHRKRNPNPQVLRTISKPVGRVEPTYDLIHEGRFAEADQQLASLAEKYGDVLPIVEARLCLYQATGDHARCCMSAQQLTRLQPDDPETRLIYAQQSLFCGRLGIALVNYRWFLKRWPDHSEAEKARIAIELVEPECETKMRDMGLGDDGLELLVMHDEAVELMHRAEFEESAVKCAELLQLAPECMSARNNLALNYFQSGECDRAVELAVDTYELAPENRFAEATLGKLSFLSGRVHEANAIADRIVANPPTEADPLSAAIELLSFLGRDENVVFLCAMAAARGIAEPRYAATLRHHLAVAHLRLGNQKAARSSWDECLQALPSYEEACNNLDDLDAGEGHAPWPEPLTKWIPRAVCAKIIGPQSELIKTGQLAITKDLPSIAKLIPALLDRGDPRGRQLALSLATADGSPDMLDALEQFAFGTRGPDAMRYKALTTLRESKRIDSGPHRFYRGGKWTDVNLLSAEIHWESNKCDSPWVQRFIDAGMNALQNDDFAVAEESFTRVLEQEPDNPHAAYNLCVIWLRRDGSAGHQRAVARLEEVHQRCPDYLFATISLAQLATYDGNLDRARELLNAVHQAKRLHGLEAIALCTAQIYLAIECDELNSAEVSWQLMAQIAGEDDPMVAALRRHIDEANHRHEFRTLL